MNYKLSQAPDEYQVEIPFNPAGQMAKHMKKEEHFGTQYSQLLPKLARGPTPMVPLSEAKQYQEICENTKPLHLEPSSVSKTTENPPSQNSLILSSLLSEKKLFTQTKPKKRTCNINSNTQQNYQKQQFALLNVVVHPDFKYQRKTLNPSSSQQNVRSSQDFKNGRQSFQEDWLIKINENNNQSNKENSRTNQLQSISEDHTEVDDDLETLFQLKEKLKQSKFHQFINMAPKPSIIVKFVKVLKKIGVVEICIGKLENGGQPIQYLRNINNISDQAKLLNYDKYINKIMLNTKYADQDNLYELIIFQGYKNLIFYWNFAKGIVNTKPEISELIKQNRIQNIYGVSEGLKGFSQAFSTEPITNFKYFMTNFFKFSIFEMCSGVKIILLSNISDQTDYSDQLKEVYTLYLEIIKKNPFYNHGDPLDNPLFMEKLTELFEPFQKKK